MIIKNIKKIIGQSAENLAAKYLKKQGLALISKNYTTKFAEIDLIMQSNDTIIFVEVRYKTNDDFGDAASSVNKYKQKKIIRGTKEFIVKNPQFGHYNIRFDVVAIDNNFANVKWLKDAFMPDYV